MKGTEITEDGINIDDITVDWSKEPDSNDQVKFAAKYDADTDTEGVQTPFLYRVGNKNAIKAGVLFEEVADKVVDSGVYVSVTSMYDEMEVMGEYKPNTTDWTKGEITFTKIGPVKVTIQDYNYCKETVIYLEVVDGNNITATSASDRTLTGWTSRGSNVLLENVSVANNGTLILANGTLYGNGFELDAANAAYSGVDTDYRSYVINVSNANIDNATITGAVYPELGTTKESNYYRPLLFVTGDEKCIFTNCHFSGTASPIRTGAKLELINTTLEGGLYANLDMRGGHLTLDNVTTINQGSATDAFGMGIVVYQEGGSEDMSITIKNDLKQYNFIAKSYAENLTGYAKTIVDTMFESVYSAFQFKDSTGEVWVNSGIISMNNYFDADDIDDQRSSGHGYSGKASTVTLFGNTRNCYVYTFKPNSDNLTENPGLDSSGQNEIRPTVAFNHAVNNVQATDENPNDYCTANDGLVTISMDQGDAAFNWKPAILNATKGDKTLPYTVTVTENNNTYSFTVDEKGTVSAKKNGTAYGFETIPFGTEGEYAATYTYTDPYNFSVNAEGKLVRYEKEYTETLTIKVIVAEPDARHAVFSFGAKGTAYLSKTVTVTLSDGNTRVYVMPDVSADENGKIGSTTVDGTTVYYPITEMYTSDGKDAHTGGWYACFPIFKDAVQIIDYADEGTGEPVTYNQDKVTTVAGIPSTLKATNPKGAFRYSMNATTYPPPTEPTAVSGAVCYTCNRSGLDSGNTRDEMTIIAEYTYTDNMEQTYYYYVGYHCAKQTKGTSDPSCLAAGTMITLADGTKRAVEDLRKGDMVMSYDHVNGVMTSNKVIIVVRTESDSYYKNTFVFDDGSELVTINEHGIYDWDLRKYVNIDHHNADEFIGHQFVAVDTNGKISLKKLVTVDTVVESGYKYDIVTDQTLNYVAEDTLSVTHVLVDVINSFDFNDYMRYDRKKMEADIEKYGLYTYDEWEEYCDISVFEQYNIPVMKVGISKGLYTKNYIIGLINTYVLDESVQIID